MDLLILLAFLAASVVAVKLFLVIQNRPNKPRDASRPHCQPDSRTSVAQVPTANSHDSDYREAGPSQEKEENVSTREEKLLKAISQVVFEPVPLFSRSEYPVFRLLEKIIRDLKAGHRVMGKTCMGEFMKTRKDSGSQEERDLAFFEGVNCKRPDFLVINPKGYPVLVVEYQGSGHDQGDAEARDAAKRAALHNASIPLLEIPAQYDQDQIEQQILSMLRPN